MAERHYEHSPYEGVPKFFKRFYDQRGAPPLKDDLSGQLTYINPLAGRAITIYGYSIRSPYPEDRGPEREAYERGMFFSMCFSELEPSGEVGFTPLRDVEEISEEDFDAAIKAIGTGSGEAA